MEGQQQHITMGCRFYCNMTGGAHNRFILFFSFLQSELFVGLRVAATRRLSAGGKDDGHLFPSAGRRGASRPTTASPQTRPTGEGRSMPSQASSPGLPRLHRGEVMILSSQDKNMNPQRNRSETQRCTMSKWWAIWDKTVVQPTSRLCAPLPLVGSGRTVSLTCSRHNRFDWNHANCKLI